MGLYVFSFRADKHKRTYFTVIMSSIISLPINVSQAYTDISSSMLACWWRKRDSDQCRTRDALVR